MNQKRSNSSNTILVAFAGLGFVAGMYDWIGPRSAQGGSPTLVDAPDGLPDILGISAVIRDFKATSEKGGHPDFESYGNSDAAMGLIQPKLDSEGKPVFADSYGQAGCASFKNIAGLRILPSLANRALGDTLGTLSRNSAKQLSSDDSFKQWYRDTPGVNISKVVPIKLNRVPGTKRYVFDSAVDEPYKSRGGFFPINGDLFGNYSSTGKNFHFTTEVECKFAFNLADNAVFTFTGDDDLWVFIDGQLVMDLGGLHPRQQQTLDVNRLAWLKEGQSYTLKIFHAERHTTESNFRIETSLQLLPAPLPPTTGISD